MRTLLIAICTAILSISSMAQTSPGTLAGFQNNRLKFFLNCMENKRDGLSIYNQLQQKYDTASGCDAAVCGLTLKTNPLGEDVIGIRITEGMTVFSWIDYSAVNYSDDKLGALGFYEVPGESVPTYKNCVTKCFLKIMMSNNLLSCQLIYAPTAYYFISCK